MSVEAQRVFLSAKVTAIDFGDLPIKMPNLPFNYPKNAAYAEFCILLGKGIPIGGFGEGKIMERSVGMVQLNIWTPDGKGTKSSSIAADLFADAFKYKLGRDSTGSTYKFKGAETPEAGTKEGWSVQVVRVTFERDQVQDVQVSL